MFKILTDKLLEPPLELMKLVKMTLSLPHGQAGVESGFSNTKSIVEGRESLNHTSVKAILENIDIDKAVPKSLLYLKNVSTDRYYSHVF